MFTVVKSGEVGFWVRTVDVLGVVMPQFEVSKVVIKVRWLFSEELHLTHSLRIYDVAMDSSSRYFYKEWRAWLNGDDRYRCEVEKPRGLARIYTKAIDVYCRKVKKDEKKEVVILPSRWRKRRYKRWTKPEPGGSAPS